MERLPEEWREREINRWIKEEFFARTTANGQSDWLRFIRYISVEFEEDSSVRLVIMTSAFIRIYIDAQLTDLWHDHRTSSLTLALRSVNLMGVPLLPQFLSRWLTHVLMSVAGFILNPLVLREGALLRFDADVISLDLHQYLHACTYGDVAKYLRTADGQWNNSFVVFGAETYLGGIKPKLCELSAAGRQRYAYRSDRRGARRQKKWFRFEDFWQLSLVAGLAFFAVVLMRPYISPEKFRFSLSWSFLYSLLLLLASLGIINLARWSYQFYWQAKRRSIAFRTEEMRYRIDRIRRDIELEMHRFHQVTDDAELEKDLFRAGLHRHKVLVLEESLEVFNRELKLKYMLAYLITIISEYVAFRFF